MHSFKHVVQLAESSLLQRRRRLSVLRQVQLDLCLNDLTLGNESSDKLRQIHLYLGRYSLDGLLKLLNFIDGGLLPHRSN